MATQSERSLGRQRPPPRPDPSDPRQGDPRSLDTDPSAVVRALREPVYVHHYFTALTESAAQLTTQGSALLRAVELVRAERWEPAKIGKDDYEYEPDWSGSDATIIKLIEALAHADADIESERFLCWSLATQLTSDLPDDLGAIERYATGSDHDGPLNRAINRPYGKGLQAVLALGGWEHRNTGSAGPQLAATLTDVLAVGGAAASSCVGHRCQPSLRRSHRCGMARGPPRRPLRRRTRRSHVRPDA